PRHEWRGAPLRPPGEMAAGLAVFRRYLEHVSACPGVEVITGRQLINLFPDTTRGAVICAADLAQAAVFDAGVIRTTWLGDMALAPSEVFSLVCDTLMETIVTLSGNVQTELADVAAIGASLESTPYGPVQRLASTITAGTRVSTESFIEAAADARQSLNYHGRIPAAVWLGAQRLSPADFLVTAAQLLRRLVLDGDSLPLDLTVHSGMIDGERHVHENVWGWPVFPENFSAPGILEHARLQTWTLKPATLVD
ncbi:MAG: hypothetical protein HOH74_05835, partial [Gemmatimonadetes bacterium]|nr:hypothetical protein [Gemmatimonadota bacterium]